MNVHLYKPEQHSGIVPFKNRFDRPMLAEHGVAMSDYEDADIVVSIMQPPLEVLRKFQQDRKHILIWTHEPRLDTGSRVREEPEGIRIHAMTTCTGDVYTDALAMYGSMMDRELPLVDKAEFFPGKKCAAIMTNKASGSEMIVESRNADLWEMRHEYVMWGHAHGHVDVYGRRWPKGIEDSYRPSPYARKQQILKGYDFNFCPENTDLPYLMTEKIFHAIGNACLPVYIGGAGTLHELFPEGTVFDMRLYASPEQLFAAIQAMTLVEWHERMNACITVWNEAVRLGLPRKSRDRMILGLLKRLKEICDEPT